MGGKKKLGIKQMEKQQVKTDEDKAAKEAKKKEKAGPPREKKQLAIVPPDVKDQKIVSEVKKLETQHKTGEITIEEYKENIDDYQREKDKAEREVNGILLRLREKMH